ncbi:MAG TPA: crosslink repair DNA glycosylase YcaQ family protein [Pyrinomonadaceae bacterium]|nr:crosslink repair DNA glycosylase YcaQ family protein [Pyrinomonadaceae bacterium]
MADSITLDDLRRYTVARNFFKPTNLKTALHRMGFVQADPIRAPARAQDLILRHRVNNYRAGELERRYATLDVEEDFFINYGYVSRAVYSLMHPRSGSIVARKDRKRAQMLLDFVRERGSVHPREVDEYFAHGKVTNYWGGSSNATTHLMDAMQYRGMLRVLRREKGIRIYAPQEHQKIALSAAERRARIDALVDVVVGIYAPLPASSLTYYVRRLQYAAPQWKQHLTDALKRAKKRLRHVRVGGDWYFPADEDPLRESPEEVVRLLAPFDPVVHDRARFKLLWDWEYRFEAYTPVVKRKLGYYAMPLLWRERVIGWANAAVKNGALECDVNYIEGYVSSRASEQLFKRELERELDRIRSFLGLE